jgi:hypothetical protein
MLAPFSKLIGTVVGSLVGAALLWLSSKTGLVLCSDAAKAASCSLLGISYDQIVGAILLMVSTYAGTYFAPANKITLQDGSQI